MIDHYNAFISYKHAPEDNIVAETVQRELERFHIPWKIRKQTGIKRINRIFRDKSELPITSDLSETISNALDNSDFLIVICSTNTKESHWVPREIEYFLRTHPISRVFTVLVNGEPDDVIPKILTQQSEPLSCDYRMPKRKANKTELPRLASAIIGCSYDELMNRRRQYILRRVIFGFSAILLLLLAFSAYMIYSRNKINENYITALRNQSKYLSNESQNMLENEQRITALQLALAALPKDEDDERPVTPEAINALSKATLVYTSPTPISVHDQWSYSMHNAIREFKVSPNASTIAAFDVMGQLQIWKTADHTPVLSFKKTEKAINGFEYASYDNLVTYNTDTINSYDTNTGEINWTLDSGEHTYSTSGFITADDYIYIYTFDQSFLKIETASGKIVDEIKINILDESSTDYLSDAVISPDKTKIASQFSIGLGSQSYIIVTDLQSKKSTRSDTYEGYITELNWLDDRDLLFSTTDDIYNNSVRFNTTDIISNDNTVIHCINTDDYSEKWKTDFTTTNVAIISGFSFPAKSNNICYYSGNTAILFDKETGEKKYEYNLNSPIIYANDVNKSGFPAFITSDGYVGLPLPDSGDDKIAKMEYFTDNLDCAVVSQGYYVHQFDSAEIIYYQDNVYDTNWKCISSDYEIINLSTAFLNEDIAAIISKGDKGVTLTAFVLKDGLQAKQIVFDNKTDSDVDIAGYNNNTIYALVNENDCFSVVKVNYETGERDLKILCETPIRADYTNELQNGKLFYYYIENGKSYLACYDVNTDEIIKNEVPEDIGYSSEPPKYFPSSNAVYVRGNKDIIFDTKTAENVEVELPKDWQGTTRIATDKSGKRFAISDNDHISVVNRTGSSIFEIMPNGVPVVGLGFYENDKADDEDMLLVIYDNGTLLRYSLKDGHYIGTSEITYENVYGNEAHLEFNYDASIAYLQTNTSLVMVDTNLWSETTSIKNCLGLHRSTDRFFTFATTDDINFQIGYFDRYSTTDLIKKAREIVGNSKLSDEQKVKYGIED